MQNIYYFTIRPVSSLLDTFIAVFLFIVDRKTQLIIIQTGPTRVYVAQPLLPGAERLRRRLNISSSFHVIVAAPLAHIICIGNTYTSQYHTRLEGNYIYIYIYNNIYYYTIIQYCIAITTVTIIYYTIY